LRVEFEEAEIRGSTTNVDHQGGAFDRRR
jgi:hypothetical protein